MSDIFEVMSYEETMSHLADIITQPKNAKFDGITDDTVAIQAAIDGLTGGGTILLPSGTAIVTTIQLPSNVYLIGHGMGVTILKQKVGTAAPILQNKDTVNGNTEIYVEGITFDGNKSAQTVGSIGVYFYKLTNSKFNRIEVKNINNDATGQALAGYSIGTIGGLHFESCTNITVSHSIITGCVNEGLRFLAGEDLTAYRCISTFNGQSGFATANLCKKGKFIQCISTDNGASNISINGNYNQVIGCYSTRSTTGNGINIGHQFADGSANADYSLVQGNVVENINAEGICVQNSKDVVVKDNYVANSNDRNIWATNGNIDGLTIENNVLVGGGPFDSISLTPYDSLTPSNTIIAKGITIKNNRIYNSNRGGIKVRLLDGFQIVGNKIYNSGQVTLASAITIEFFNPGSGNIGCLNGVVDGNICTDTQGTKTQNYGIEVSPSAVTDYLTIINNMVNGNKTAGMSTNNGPNNIVRNNQGYVTENGGTSNQNGNGSLTTFTIAHGLARTPRRISVTAGSAAANGFSATFDATNITVTYTTAPASGSGNVVLIWEAKY